MVSLLSTMFHEILFSSFRGVALTNCVTDRWTDWQDKNNMSPHKNGGGHNLRSIDSLPDVFFNIFWMWQCHLQFDENVTPKCLWFSTNSTSSLLKSIWGLIFPWFVENSIHSVGNDRSPTGQSEWKFQVASKIHCILADLAGNSCKASRNLKTLATITGLQL